MRGKERCREEGAVRDEPRGFSPWRLAAAQRHECRTGGGGSRLAVESDRVDGRKLKRVVALRRR